MDFMANFLSYVANLLGSNNAPQSIASHNMSLKIRSSLRIQCCFMCDGNPKHHNWQWASG